VLTDPADAAQGARLFGVEPAGPLDGRSVLAWRGDDAEAVRRRRDGREALRRARAERPAPRRDEPAIASYVGLMLRGLVAAAADLPTPAADRALALARRAADALHARAWTGRRLRRVVDAPVGDPDHDVALLDDQVHPALAYLALQRATGDRRYLGWGLDLAAAVAADFAAPGGGFTTVPRDAAAPLLRPTTRSTGRSRRRSRPPRSSSPGRPPGPSATTGGRPPNARWAAPRRRPGWPRPPRCRRCWRRVSCARPRSRWWWSGADDPRSEALLAIARAHPRAACVVRSDGPDDPWSARLPWLAGRAQVGGAPTAYACSVGVCRRPVHTPTSC
jgi:uncharacterized protein